MQPFDALTMRAIIAEARALVLNRKVEKVFQTARDEVVIALRARTGVVHLLVSAQASFGRLGLVQMPAVTKGQNAPQFCQILRKHLHSATLIEIEQLSGERVCDITFSCSDELGNRSKKVLTAEIMGRHSNLIFWDTGSGNIIGASHAVTSEMSRQREVAMGLTYARPPAQDKLGIFSVSKEEFLEKASEQEVLWKNEGSGWKQNDCENWLVATFSGLGRHLAEELTGAAFQSGSEAKGDGFEASVWKDALWQKVCELQGLSVYRGAMRNDLTRYTVLPWQDCPEPDWQSFATVNDMVDTYFKSVHLRTEMQQVRDRIKTELKGEQDKLRQRIEAAEKLLAPASDPDVLKKYGDLILANLKQVAPGQSVLECDDFYSEAGGAKIAIDMNPDLSASQNAQHYYRLYAKGRARSKAATSSLEDAHARLEDVKDMTDRLETAKTMDALLVLKELVVDRGKRAEHGKPAGARDSKSGPRLLSFKSADGFTVLIGRNRYENDYLVSKLTQSHDIWLHVLGSEGAHVVIKLPNKKDPPATTLKEAAVAAARFARVGPGAKVRVIYTFGKHVKKIAGDKPGLVRYENEKTLEIDTAQPLPASVRKLFS